MRTWREGTRRENPPLSTPTSFFMLTLPVIFLVLYELCQLCSSSLVLGILVWLLWGKGLSGPHPLRGNVWQEKPLRGGSKICPFPGLLPGAPRINSAPAPRTSARLGGHPNGDL